eukprot:COSAG01_NODE_11647_length_1888_cov_8.899346_2_plen_251_part_00
MLGYHNACLQGVQSALASVGSRAYADYMVDAMANTWTGALGIDGYTEDCSCNYPCMLQLSEPERGSLPDWASIVGRVRRQQPQLVMSGEGYGSWAEMIIADANLGGQGSAKYHVAFQKAVTDGDASGLEELASTSGADAASVLCYLNPAYDGKQPGGCPTMYYRDMTATMKNLKQHVLWVALEAGSGIVSQVGVLSLIAPTSLFTTAAAVCLSCICDGTLRDDRRRRSMTTTPTARAWAGRTLSTPAPFG